MIQPKINNQMLKIIQTKRQNKIKIKQIITVIILFKVLDIIINKKKIYFISTYNQIEIIIHLILGKVEVIVKINRVVLLKNPRIILIILSHKIK